MQRRLLSSCGRSQKHRAEHWQAVARRFRDTLPCATRSSADTERRASQGRSLGLNLPPNWKLGAVKQVLPAMVVTPEKVRGEVCLFADERMRNLCHSLLCRLLGSADKWLTELYTACCSPDSRTQQKTVRFLKRVEECEDETKLLVVSRKWKRLTQV